MSESNLPPEDAPTRRPRRPGPLAPLDLERALDPRFPGRSGRGPAPVRGQVGGSYEGVPGGLGALLSVTAAIVCGPIAGVLVSLVGGLVFVPLVTDFGRGTQFSIFLWLIASLGAGVISGRLRQSDEERAAAVARERLAGNRLHRLQGVTEVLAGATTPEEVAQATVSAAMSALGADAGGFTVRIADDPETLQVLAASTLDDGVVAGWRRHR